MSRFIEGQDRSQVTLLPECLDDFIADDNPVRLVDVFIGELDMVALGFEGAIPATTGLNRPVFELTPRSWTVTIPPIRRCFSACIPPG